MTAPATDISALGDARAEAMRDLKALLASPDAIDQVGFEVWDRVRPIAGSCLQRATRLIRFAGQNAAVRLDEVQRQRAAACIARAGWAPLTTANIDQCLRSAPCARCCGRNPIGKERQHERPRT